VDFTPNTNNHHIYPIELLLFMYCGCDVVVLSLLPNCIVVVAVVVIVVVGKVIVIVLVVAGHR